MTKIFRVKCVSRPSQDGHEDAHISTGKFYNVMDVTPSYSGVEFFWIKGDLGESVWRAASWFSRPMKKKIKKTLTKAGRCFSI